MAAILPLIDHWIRTLTSERRLAASTIANYEMCVRHIARQCDFTDTNDLTVIRLRAYLGERRTDGVKARSLATELNALRAFARFLYKEHGVTLDGVKRITTPRLPQHLPRPLDMDKTKELCAAPEHTIPWVSARDAAVLALLYGCGLRISECLGLNGGDLDAITAGEITVNGKGGKQRQLPILPVVKATVLAYAPQCPFPITTDGPLFFGRHGDRLSPRTVQHTVQQMRSRLGLPDSATPHALRHSFASHLLNRGGDLRAIQELLGHASLTSTQIYTKLDTARLLEVYDQTHPRS